MAAKKVSSDPAGARSSGFGDMFLWVMLSDYPKGDIASSRNCLRELKPNIRKCPENGLVGEHEGKEIMLQRDETEFSVTCSDTWVFRVNKQNRLQGFRGQT
jgi:hypothetical protein